MSAQSFVTEEKTITGTFDAKERNKSELYASINKWISINYNSAINVIQLNDLESGIIIVKGINELEYNNTTKQIYPKMKDMPELLKVRFNHLIEFNIKDNKFRIIYKIIGLNSEEYDNLFFNCINLDTIDNNAIQKYNLANEELLRKGGIGKEKRDALLNLSVPMFQDINTKLSDNMKNTMLSIEKSILEPKDNW
jgi:hypothetical protein